MGGSLEAVPTNMELPAKPKGKKLVSVGTANSMQGIDPGAHSYYQDTSAGRYAQSTDQSNQY
jgi:hypothetical protein